MRTGLGMNIKQLRKDRSLSQDAFASLLRKATGEDVSQGHISAIERGAKLPSVPLLIAMADFFEVSIDVLVGRPEYEKIADEELYFSEEAEEAARSIDAMTPERRQDALAVVRALMPHDGGQIPKARQWDLIINAIYDEHGEAGVRAIEQKLNAARRELSSGRDSASPSSFGRSNTLYENLKSGG
jgi:transcriptional regulator with XRE-family HTH domain